MTDFHLHVVEREPDADEIRADLESLTTAALTFADRLAEQVLVNATDVHLVAVASAYKQARHTMKKKRRSLVSVVSG